MRGALSSAAVLVACDAAVRLTHFGAYLVAAGDDRGVRRRVLITVPISFIPAIALLITAVMEDRPRRDARDADCGRHRPGEQAMRHLDDGRLGALGAWTLGGGRRGEPRRRYARGAVST